MYTRRSLLGLGGALAAGSFVPLAFARANEPVEIVMGGNADGSRVGFDPVGLRVEPGQTLRWVNRDAGNAHTATAYHPALMGRPLRIPDGAEPWDSDYLLPGQSFSVTLTVPGIYDYYCLPHEHAGMVGRIVVGAPRSGWRGYVNPADGEGGLPQIALEGFPAVEEIMRIGVVAGRR